MRKDRGFAPVIVIVLLVLLAMATAQCDVRHATASTNPSTTIPRGIR